MEKTLSFAVFKEKIIKTNELLNLLLERNKSLEKSQKWNQHLKNRLELSKNEVNKLKLKNETLTYNFTTTEKNYSVLKNEHEDLKEQFSRLQHDSDHTINTLQNNYQLVNQELTECKEKLTVLQSADNLEESLEDSKRRSKSPKKKPSLKKDKKVSGEAVCNKKIEELRSEKEKLLGEKCDLQLEVYELKKQIENLKSLQNGAEKGNLQIKEELAALKTTFKDTLESKSKKIDKLLSKIKTTEEERDTLQNDNDRLKIENVLSHENSKTAKESDSVNNKELIKLKKKLLATIEQKNDEITTLSKKIEELSKESKKFQQENIKLRVENSLYQDEISNLQEKYKQKENKPCQDLPEFLTENVENRDSAENVAPQRQKKISTTPTDEEICAIMKNMVTPVRVSPLSLDDELDDRDLSLPLVPTDLPQPKEVTNKDLQTMVNKRRVIMKRRKELAKRKMQNVHANLHNALISLKKANIHFLISSHPLVPSARDYPPLIKYKPKNVKYKNVEKKKVKTITEELNCTFKECKKTFMVLQKGEEEKDTLLLGFMDIKDENVDQQKNDNFVSLKLVESQIVSNKGESSVDFNNQSLGDVSNETLESPQNKSLEYKNKSDDLLEPSSNSEDENITPLKVNTCNRSVQKRRSGRKIPQVSVIKKRKLVSKSKPQNHDFLDICEDESNVCSAKTLDFSPIKTVDAISDDFVFKKPLTKPKSPKTAFKRPVCSTRRSLRLATVKEPYHENMVEDTSENIPLESPKSPTSECEARINTPVIIPLERESDSPETVPEIENVVESEQAVAEKMPTTKIETLFNKLIVYSTEEEALNEVVREFSLQEPSYIAEAILERIALDYHDKADTKYHPAPLMTDVQRTMLGFMSKLEKSNITGVFDSYLTLAEQRLLTCKTLPELNPITRLYLAVCKLRKNLTRMRKLCCDVFYFCGDLAVPFFFTVLTSWTEVLPHAADAKDFPIARVLVQIVYTTDCNKPGYNLMALRDLLIKFYGYPSERWDHNEFFKELLDIYLKKPARSSDFALLLYCKSRPEKWVYDKIEEHLKPLISMNIQDNFKATLIILIGNLYNRFSSKSEMNYMPAIKEWLTSLITEGTPDVVKRCVYVSLNRLKKK